LRKTGASPRLNFDLCILVLGIKMLLKGGKGPKIFRTNFWMALKLSSKSSSNYAFKIIKISSGKSKYLN
jgi:hypothetical protein